MCEIKEMSLRLPNIGFDMPITDAIMELEKLRYKRLGGTTLPCVFFQLQYIFHMLESIGSSRIEGNNTTVMDYVETTKLNNPQQSLFGDKDDIKQIENGEEAMRYIEENIADIEISKHFLRELHVLTVKDLDPSKEGARNPGLFRSGNVKINKSDHLPPDYTQVDALMDELIDFVNEECSPKYDLLKVAIAHHRFVWIHPFENGNGRVVRLLTYAILLKKKIFYRDERIVNPTAVFCSDRQKYYDYLSMADEGTDCGLIAWAEYMLAGLKTEIEKVDKLLDYDYLFKHILIQTIDDAFENRYINDVEYEVLNIALQKQVVQASDIGKVLGKNSPEVSRIIRSLRDKNMLMPIQENARKYYPLFNNSKLIRSIITKLDENGFLPNNLNN
jgi:Fic family protein